MAVDRRYALNNEGQPNESLSDYLAVSGLRLSDLSTGDMVEMVVRGTQDANEHTPWPIVVKLMAQQLTGRWRIVPQIVVVGSDEEATRMLGRAPDPDGCEWLTSNALLINAQRIEGGSELEEQLIKELLAVRGFSHLPSYALGAGHAGGYEVYNRQLMEQGPDDALAADIQEDLERFAGVKLGRRSIRAGFSKAARAAKASSQATRTVGSVDTRPVPAE